MMKCPYCGKEHDGKPVCPSCKAAQPKEEPKKKAQKGKEE